MNRPGFKTYLIGNPVSCLAIVGGCFYVIYRWFTDQAAIGWPVPVIAAFVAMWALDAASKIAQYRSWKQAWDSMGGEAPAPRSGNGLRAARLAILLAAYVGLGLVLADPRIGSDDTRKLVALLFGIMTLAFSVAGIRWVVKRTRSSNTGTATGYPGKDHTVTQCLPTAQHPPTPLEAVDRLPGYCRVLIESSRKASRSIRPV